MYTLVLSHIPAASAIRMLAVSINVNAHMAADHNRPTRTVCTVHTGVYSRRACMFMNASPRQLVEWHLLCVRVTRARHSCSMSRPPARLPPDCTRTIAAARGVAVEESHCGRNNIDDKRHANWTVEYGMRISVAATRAGHKHSYEHGIG